MEIIAVLIVVLVFGFGLTFLALAPFAAVLLSGMWFKQLVHKLRHHKEPPPA